MRAWQPYVIGALFVAAGCAHFALTPAYAAIVPPGFPAPVRLVQISGACEILGGLGVMVPAARTFSAWGLIALLVAVFPANVWMAADPQRFPSIAPLVLYARLPLQFMLMWWIRAACLTTPREVRERTP